MKVYRKFGYSDWKEEYKKKLHDMSIAELDNLYTQLKKEIIGQVQYTEDVDKFRMVSEELDGR